MSERKVFYEKNVFVGPHKGGGWQAKKAGATRASVVAPTQAAAIEEGRRLAKSEGSELIVQGRNGQIREEDSQGHDPRRTRG
jgi:hypothetical protein